MKRMARSLRQMTCLAGASLALSIPVVHAQGDSKSQPTFKNSAYGPHERNVLDFWRAESTTPTPLVVYIHGGGFRAGSKESIDQRTLRELLDAGISVAAINYRFISNAPLPAAHYDGRRALQFLRSKADEWNLDKARVGAFGGSAGAQICMYLAFHDEMADKNSPDPIERQSTRLSCVATNGGQTTMDVDWWLQHIPEYKPHRNFTEALGVSTKEDYLKRVAEVSALSLITKDDPAIFMSYAMAPGDPVPADSQRAEGWKVHHVVFGLKLKEKMDGLGVEAHLQYPGARMAYRAISDFFIQKLAANKGPK